MTKLRTAAFAIISLALSVTRGMPEETTPDWSIALHGVYLDGNNSGIAAQNRACGISRWDEAHVLVYYLMAKKHLAARGSVEEIRGGWSFAVQVIRTADGRIDQTATIPAWSSRSELAVVKGGIVESDPGRLTFYSRALQHVANNFSYTPIEHLPSELSGLHGLGASGQLYAAADGNRFVLVDSATQESRFFVFDGTTFQNLGAWTVSGVTRNSVSLIPGGVLFTKGSDPTRVYGISFRGRPFAFENRFDLRDPQLCSVPISPDSHALLYVCGGVLIIDSKHREVIYRSGDREVVGLPIAISPDAGTVAVFHYTYRGGGILDTTERVVRDGLLIINTRSENTTCEIPIVPLPTSQLAFQFAGDSTLIVVNDSKVVAYRGPCGTR